MKVSAELEPRLAEIRRLALDFFSSTELAPIGLHLDSSGEVAFDTASPMNQPNFSKPWDEEAREQLVAVGRERLPRLHDDLDALLARFRAYYDLDSLDLTAMAGVLGVYRGAPRGDLAPANIYDRIGHADADLVANVKTLIREPDWWKADEPQWSGNAARAFREQFLDPMHDAAQLQQWYLMELGVVVQAYHDYVDEIGQALTQVADVLIGKLGGSANVIGEEELTNTINALSIASIITGLLAFFPPLAVPAGAVSVTAGITSFVLPLSSDVVPKREVYLDGASIWEVLDSAWQALNTIEEIFTDGDTKLSGALEKSLSSGLGFGNADLIVELPGVTNRPGGSSFGKLKIDRAPDVPLNEDPVVVSIVDLYRAGKVNLAGAATQYAQAAQELWSCDLPPSLGKFFVRSVSRFYEARGRFESILNRTGFALDVAADALIAIARNYELSDERAAEVTRQANNYRTPDIGGGEPDRAGGV